MFNLRQFFQSTDIRHYSLATASTLLAIFPEKLFDNLITINFQVFTPEINNALHIASARIIFVVAIFFLFSIFSLIKCYICGLSIPIHGAKLKIEYGDILKKHNCRRVINFDECFTITVGHRPQDIQPGSLCGQYLTQYPMSTTERQALIAQSGIKPCALNSRFSGWTRYKSGLIISRNDDLLLAFARLDENGNAWMTYKWYIECLNLFWKELRKYCSYTDVCIPILGAGLTHFDGHPYTQQELLDIMVSSYRLSSDKLEPHCTLRIICSPADGFSLFNIR